MRTGRLWMATSGVTAALAGGRVEWSMMSEYMQMIPEDSVEWCSTGQRQQCRGEVPAGPTGEDSVCECTVKTAVLSCAASSIDQSSVHGLTLKPATTLAIYV